MDDLCTLPEAHPGAHNMGNRWERQSPDDNAPPPAPGRSHRDYLDHPEAARDHLGSSGEAAQVHASLAIAAAVNQVADLLERQHRAPGG